VAGSQSQRRALERLVESVSGLRNLGSGHLSCPLPAQADVILAEILRGESPQQSLHGPPYWLALLEDPRAGWVNRPAVRGSLPRLAGEGEVEAALRAVGQGLLVTHPDLSPTPTTPLTPLSSREQEVLAFLALGRSNKEIANQLTITEHTVKFHLASLFQKLQASNRSQAIANGLRHGWVRL
jgi:DNA-binding CsgD family transcriptional regulator